MSSAGVCGSISSIVDSFSKGLDILKRLRARPRSGKNRKDGQNIRDESKLSKSLKRGPADIKREYERRYEGAGERFARGDAIAQASLTETLFKLNTGLVGIISSFLCNGRNELQLDYKSLTNLSDASRSDAIETLSQLYERLSQSSLALNSVKACCSHCETGRYATLAVPKGVNNALPCRHPHRSRRKKKQAVNRANFSSPTVARVPLKSSSQTQMVIVRPRNRRTASSSSNSSSNSHSTDHTTAMTALSSSTTLPRASSFPTQTAASRLVTQKSKPRSNQRTRTWPQVQNANQETSISATLNSSLNTPMSATSARASSLAPVPRRLDKTTPSAYSWASDSTKLGEIPMRKWTFPSDYESMETINAEAAASGAIECRGKSKWKLFGFLRRGGEMV